MPPPLCSASRRHGAARSTASFPAGLRASCTPSAPAPATQAGTAGRPPAIGHPTSDGKAPKQRKQERPRLKPALEREDLLHGSDPSASRAPATVHVCTSEENQQDARQ